MFILMKSTQAHRSQRVYDERLASARNGDADAFTALLHEHGPMVYNTARGMLGPCAEIDDVYQIVFMKFLKHLDRLDRERNIPGWLRRVTVNECMNWLSRAKKNHVLSRCELDQLPTPSPSDTEQLSWLWRQLEILTPRERAAMVLVYQQGLSTKEAARVLGCRAATIRAMCFKSRQKIRKRLPERSLL